MKLSRGGKKRPKKSPAAQPEPSGQASAPAKSKSSRSPACDATALDRFCRGVELSEISLTDWEDCHQSLDLTVPLFISAPEAAAGAERALAFSRTLTSHGKPQRSRVQCQVTVPPRAAEGQILVIPGEGDGCDGRFGDLRVIIRIKPAS